MQVNIWAIIAAAIVNIVIGYVWFLPAIFGSRWMAAVGVQKETVQANMGRAIALGLVAALITAYVLDVALILAGISTVAAGALAGFLIAVGFVVTTMYGAVIWSSHSHTAFAIEAVCEVVIFTAMAALLAVWG